jgi:ComF family protein
MSTSINLSFPLGLWNGFLHLLFPDLCVACERELPAPGACFCLACRIKLAPSDMYLQADNEFTHRFWGRLHVEAGAAMYYFHRKSPIQHALHQLKYHNKPQIGLQIGREFGRKLARAPVFETVQLVVPVPLHPRKERLRGYNQTALLAEGLAESMGVACARQALRRHVFAESQTRKKRLDRFQNVRAAFQPAQPALLQGRHVLLVDDVLTTGATLEACGQSILDLPGTRLSLATIAIAMI